MAYPHSGYFADWHSVLAQEKIKNEGQLIDYLHNSNVYRDRQEDKCVTDYVITPQVGSWYKRIYEYALNICSRKIRPERILQVIFQFNGEIVSVTLSIKE